MGERRSVVSVSPLDRNRKAGFEVTLRPAKKGSIAQTPGGTTIGTEAVA